jgi:AAA+ superfamily predicted ATPase
MMPALEIPAAAIPRERPFLHRLRLAARLRVLWMRMVWASSSGPGAQGLAITDADIDRTLQDPAELAAAEAEFYRTDEAARQLKSEMAECEAERSRDAEWQALTEGFGLSAAESDLLSLAVAVEADPWWRRVCGYLQDDATASYATPWLCSHLFGWQPGTRLGGDSKLVRWRLAAPAHDAANRWSFTAAWVADPQIVNWLLGSPGYDPALGNLIAQNSAEVAQPCLYPEVLAAMQSFALPLLHDGAAPVWLELTGPEGAGKQILAAQFAAGLGANLFVAESAQLAGSDVTPAMVADRIARAARAASLSGAVLYWRAADRVDPKIWAGLEDYSGLTLFSAAGLLSHHADARAVSRSFSLPALTRRERGQLWQRVGAGPVPAPVAEWNLTAGEIAAAALAAPAGAEAVLEACRAKLRQAPGELFVAMPCPYSWDDIVLTATLREHLEELEMQHRLRFAVLEDWGFDRLFPLGRGVTALFAGPSGTGKTMAAQVVARSLGMELYRVDLAGVVNKYIGETEKRLKRVFDACERSNALLFFDEADALFGQRMQVKDAHDRFANIEIDYLLQRMEHYEGIAILATNRKEDLDKAFMRRLRFVIDFLPPGPAERLALWRKALPEKSPGGQTLLDDAIDWQLLADRLNLTGADIKSASLGAAFLAQAAGGRITMEHLLNSVRRQMSKHGHVLRAGDLGPNRG